MVYPTCPILHTAFLKQLDIMISTIISKDNPRLIIIFEMAAWETIWVGKSGNNKLKTCLQNSVSVFLQSVLPMHQVPQPKLLYWYWKLGNLWILFIADRELPRTRPLLQAIAPPSSGVSPLVRTVVLGSSPGPILPEARPAQTLREVNLSMLSLG